MTLAEIKDAIEKGKTVYQGNRNYIVIKDSIGQYLIKCTLNDYCIGLTWKDKVTMNGTEESFFTDEN